MLQTTAEDWFKPLILRKRDDKKINNYIRNLLEFPPSLTEEESEGRELDFEYPGDIFSRYDRLSLTEINFVLSRRAANDPFLHEYGMIPQGASLHKNIEIKDAAEMLQMGWFEQEVHSDPTIDLVPFWDAGSIEALWENSLGWEAALSSADIETELDEEILYNTEDKILEWLPVVEYDVIPGPWPGILGIIPRPRGGDWLEDEAQSWQASGVHVVISLLTPEEVSELHLRHEAERCREVGLEFHAFPIPEHGVPSSQMSWTKLINQLKAALEAGKVVTVHSRHNSGRSSLLGASLLVSAGQVVDKAFRYIEEACGRSVPDTTEQYDWLVQMASRASGVK